MITIEMLSERITALEAQKQAAIRNAELQLAACDGAIAILRELLAPLLDDGQRLGNTDADGDASAVRAEEGVAGDLLGAEALAGALDLDQTEQPVNAER